MGSNTPWGRRIFIAIFVFFSGKCAKTIVFLRFFAYRKLFAQAQKRCKISPGVYRTELFTKIALKTRLVARRARFWRGLVLSWAAFGRHLAGFWALLGGSWHLLGASWPPLGGPWAAQAAPRAPTRRPLTHTWATFCAQGGGPRHEKRALFTSKSPKRRQDRAKRPQGSILGALGVDLGPFWVHFGTTWAPFGLHWSLF